MTLFTDGNSQSFVDNSAITKLLEKPPANSLAKVGVIY